MDETQFILVSNQASEYLSQLVNARRPKDYQDYLTSPHKFVVEQPTGKLYRITKEGERYISETYNLHKIFVAS